ncbi:MAG: DsbA family oxidoreductase [Chthoniobacterales bacterium]|nr:DsbA family oxidoreductase [Chthoniobacterales bacterium]
MAVHVDVWSDYVCPFCYLEEPVLNEARKEFGDRLKVRWRAFELRPEPVPTLPPRGEYLLDIWERAVYPMARDRGMKLQLPPVQPRSRLALEAAEFAGSAGKFDAMHTALFRAFFEEGRDIGDVEVLVEIGEANGLEGDALRRALQGGLYRAQVLEDEALAASLELTGVPALLVREENVPIESARVLSGAQPLFMVRAAIESISANSRATRAGIQSPARDGE